MDNSNSWNKNKNNSKAIPFIIYKIRKQCSIDILKKIYSYLAIVYPHLLYGAALWGEANIALTDSLFITQGKKMLRTTFFLGRCDHTNQLFNEQSFKDFWYYTFTNLFICL